MTMGFVGTSPEVVEWYSILRTWRDDERMGMGTAVWEVEERTDRFSLDDFAKNDVFVVQVVCLRDGNEELGAIGVFTSVGLETVL